MATSFYRPQSMAHAPGRYPEGRHSRSTLLLLVGFLLLALVVISQLGENGMVSWFRLHAEVNDLERETATLEAENQDLEGRIDALIHDPETLEKIARERFNMKHEGEEVLMVLPVEKVADVPRNPGANRPLK